jgi:hypothetical protein
MSGLMSQRGPALPAEEEEEEEEARLISLGCT